MNTPADPAGAALWCEQLSVRLGELEVLRNVDLRLAPAEHVLVVGPSGVGKSTLLRTVAGLLAPVAGRIGYGAELWSCAATAFGLAPELRRIGMIAQDLALWPHLTAAAHLQLALRWRGVPRVARSAEVDRLLALVHLRQRAGHRPGQLSGGENQRLALARALAGGTRLLLLDEPFANLDFVLRAELGAQVAALARASGTAVLHVSHAAEDAAAHADRILLLEGATLQDLQGPAAATSPFATRLRARLFPA